MCGYLFRWWHCSQILLPQNWLWALTLLLFYMSIGFYIMLSIHSWSLLCETSAHAASQPQLGSPRLVQRGSTWIQIVWEPLDCDGGYPLSSYLVDYRVAASIYSSYTTIRVVTGLNYTIRDLSPSTEYSIKVGRENSVDTMISYSGTISVMTLNAGNVYIFASFFSLLCT